MIIVLEPKVSTWLRILAFKPVRAAITDVTEATPMTIPIVVNIERVLFAHICPIARYAL
jgi:hypothetical protein